MIKLFIFGESGGITLIVYHNNDSFINAFYPYLHPGDVVAIGK